MNAFKRAKWALATITAEPDDDDDGAGKSATGDLFAHQALDQLPEEEQTALEAQVVKKCGGLPDILSGYFGTLLPCVIVDREVMVAESGTSLHIWLQQGIMPPFEMDDTEGIVGCDGLDALVQELLERVEKKLAEA